MILIVSNKWDVTVDFVVKELRQRGAPFLRLNTEDLGGFECTSVPLSERLTIRKHGKDYSLGDEIRVVWYRRPGKPYDGLPAADCPSRGVRRFVSEQWAIWLEALELCPGIAWVNAPAIAAAMENKIRQLALARRLGFEIPETLVSNDPVLIRKTVEGWGGVAVAKALYSPLIEEEESDSFIFTTAITAKDLEADAPLRAAPAIYQPALVPKVDYRVTVIRRRIFVARVESDSEVPLDWRTKKNGLRFSRCEFPDDLAERCVSYVREAGLVFGAIDLAEHAGRFFFLEINPSGEWGWLQKPSGFPIAQAMCDVFAELANVHR